MTTFKAGNLFLVTAWAVDVPKSLHFYRDILGLDLLPHHGNHPVFTVGDDLHLIIRKGTPVAVLDAEPFPVIAFQVADLHQAIQQLQANDVKLSGDILTKPGVRYIMFYDPAGNLLEIAEFSNQIH
jgi:catechol 2,3-dioxygenase-like lactoylglutathione lyase family enzyme